MVSEERTQPENHGRSLVPCTETRNSEDCRRYLCSIARACLSLGGSGRFAMTRRKMRKGTNLDPTLVAINHPVPMVKPQVRVLRRPQSQSRHRQDSQACRRVCSYPSAAWIVIHSPNALNQAFKLSRGESDKTSRDIEVVAPGLRHL